MARFEFVLLLLAAATLMVACSDDGSSASTARDTRVDAVADTADSDSVSEDTETTTDGDAATDADGPDVDSGPTVPDPLTPSWCFREMLSDERGGADYDQFEPTVGSHCLGTDHQDIQGVQKLVFVGDSVTTGTPPTLSEEYYTTLLAERVDARFEGELVVENYAGFGRRVDDLIQAPHQMLVEAFPAVEPLTTLVVFTIGGNDIFAWAEDAAEGVPLEEIEAQVDAAIALLSEALAYLDDPERFPNGNFVIFSNVFEYTDGTGDTASCPPAAAMGLGEEWEEGRAPVLRFNESFMRLAVEHDFDMIFMLEEFCGHGFRRDDPTGQCYRGPDAEEWFDFTCIHPTPTGHAAIAEMFAAVVEE